LPTYDPVARIDLAALSHNFGEVRRLVGPRVRILAMVKANAYGHGAFEVTQRLKSAGADRFGVATLDEAEAIAAARGTVPCLVFGGMSPAEAERAASLDVEVVTDSIDVITALGARASAVGRVARVHLKVDTGMHRLGVALEDAVELAETAAATPGVELVALCSHFAMAESVATDVTDGQLERLLAASQAVAGRGIRLAKHIANSAAVMTRPEAHLDMVRPGLMVYGLYPDDALQACAALDPVMTLEACVVRVASVGPGEGIGYGHTFRAPGRMRIATLRCGYADGYPRALSNRGEVLVEGSRAAIVGRVCMDHVMIDVSGIEGVCCGTRVTMWGAGMPTETVAERAGTIAYELVARLGTRVKRLSVG
jgi:alanine racemase